MPDRTNQPKEFYTPQCVSEAEKWFTLDQAVRRDTHAGSILIQKNFPHLRRVHAEQPHSTLLLVGGESEDQWHGIAGVYAACNIVTITFIFVKPQYRNVAVFVGLLNAVRKFGQEYYYAYVRFPCPCLPGLESMHELFSALPGVKDEKFNFPDGTEVVSYLTPRLAFESLVH